MTLEQNVISLVEKQLPIDEKELKKEFDGRIREFKKIILAKRENADFFQSPTDYFKKKGLLSVDSIELPGNVRIPVIDDKTTIDHIRSMRKKIEAGESMGLVLQGLSACILIKDVAVRRDVVLWVRTKVFRHKVDQIISKDDDILFSEIDFGPLMSPKTKNELKFALQQIVIKEMMVTLKAKEDLLNKKISQLDMLMQKIR